MDINWHFNKGIESKLDEKVKQLVGIINELNLETLTFEYYGFNRVEVKIWKRSNSVFDVTLEDESDYDRENYNISKSECEKCKELQEKFGNEHYIATCDGCLDKRLNDKKASNC